MTKRSKHSDSTQNLFSDEQIDMFEKSYEERIREEKNKPVECLGKTFPNDEARREYYLEKLREKLKDPEFRKIEGFPIGSDEDILNLSDPPYYTACPNPWIANFITEWEKNKPQINTDKHGLEKGNLCESVSICGSNSYHREPFAADVSEGKNDPIYNAHSYHTKVPHKAIMRYILHYTEPGDIVFDGFCGTGMTGVAAQMCGDREVVMSLGYQVKLDGTILQEEIDENGKKIWRPFSKLGSRRAVLNDLSPAATFIAYNYNTPVDVAAFEKEAKRILREVEKECGWMYETLHTDGKTKGKINYTVWSDVFLCPDCSEELIFWEIAVDHKENKVIDDFICPKCSASLDKTRVSRALATYFDQTLNDVVRVAKQKPVLINYSVEGIKGRIDKIPDYRDLELIDKIKGHKDLKICPTLEIPESDKTGEPLRIGISHTHLFYTNRNRITLNKIFSKNDKPASWKAHATALINSKMNRWPRQRGPLSLTLFVGSIVYENNVFKTTNNRRFPVSISNSSLVSTQSSTHLLNNKNILDYVFIDPPFGSNIYYSDLNLVWESWLRIQTNNNQEAIESKAQGKSSDDYRGLMKAAFQNAYGMLKPGHWMTVEFSNTKASIWNGIQTAITEAGFIVANVSALDKKQGSFNAVTNTTSVKQDLVISAYKPNGGFEERFQKEAQTEEGVWDFVRTHLKYLPVIKRHGTLLQFIPERDPRILFDQMVAFYVRKGFSVPVSSQDFQVGLAQRFVERDGMYFLSEQIAEYDRKKMTSGSMTENYELFVKDEASMLQWLRVLLKNKPQTFSDINPQFMQQLGGWSKNESQLDLRELLNQNFLCYDGKGPVPEQIHSYLSTNWKDMRNLNKEDPALKAKAKDRWYVPDPNKSGDLEKIREKALLKEFEEYKQIKKKLKVFRLEAVRAGFKKAWNEREYNTIITVAEKIPNSVLEEDPKLLMWYDQAVTRMGGK